MAVSYNKDTDYQKLIEEAAKAGDFLSAAKYEQQRNAKIAGLNSSGDNKWGATQTTNYAQYLDDEYTPHGNYFDAEMSASDKSLIQTLQDAYNTYNSLGNRAGMDNVHEQAEAIRANYGYSGGGDGSQYIKLNNGFAPQFSYGAAPSYTDKYQSHIDDLLNQILNREDFSYDVTKDPLYGQYAQQYQQQGHRSMRDTLGQLAARTGGLASSYAASAAQQANDYYMSQLANKVPELYQLAYGMYLDDKESQVQDLGILQNMSDSQYNRFRDTLSDWRNDRDFAYNKYRDQIGDSRYDSETSYNQALGMAELLGSMGNFSGYADLGMSADNIAALEQAWKDMQNQKADSRTDDTLSLSQAMSILKENPYNENALGAYQQHTGVSYLEGNDDILTGKSPAYTNLLAQIKYGHPAAEDIIAAIKSAYSNGYMSEEEANILMDYAGL